MVDFFEAWDERRNRGVTPAGGQPVAAPITGGGTAYGLAALRGEVDNIAAVPIGSGRNDQLNRSAVKMYGLAAAGQIDERMVTETLGAADGGLEYPATRRTLQSAREAVYSRLGARAVPESTVAAKRQEIMPWEQSDDPLLDNYVEPAAGSPGIGSSTAQPATGAAATTAGHAGIVEGAASSTGTEDADAAEAAHAAFVKAEATRVRIQRDARRLVDHEDAARVFRVPEYLPTLADELALPDEPVTFRVERLIPTGGNVLLAAQFKAGKTTLIANLARSLADGLPFLGRYEIAALAGRVAIFNYEVDRSQFRSWLRDLRIDAAERVNVLPLRGFRLPLIVPHIEDWVVEYLKRCEAEVWIVDPLARAMSGSVTDENNNTEVGAFLEALDVIKERAGVSELIVPAHTGRAEQEQGDERARGATRLDDWADVRWLLTKDKHDGRYFRATGRDVETDEAALAFDPSTRQLTLTGGDRHTVDQALYRDKVLTIVRNHAGHGSRELRDAVRSMFPHGKASNTKIDDAVARLIESGEIHKRRAGHVVGHFLGRGPGVEVDPLET